MATPKITLKTEFLHIEDQGLTVAQVFFDYAVQSQNHRTQAVWKSDQTRSILPLPSIIARETA